MRLFIHLINFPEGRLPELKKLKILTKREGEPIDSIVFIDINTISTTDDLIEILCNKFMVAKADVIIKLVVVGKF